MAKKRLRLRLPLSKWLATSGLEMTRLAHHCIRGTATFGTLLGKSGHWQGDSERCARAFYLFTCDALGPHEPGGPTFSGFHLHSRTGTAACKECGDASEISVSSLLVIASAKVSKLTICITKAPGPPITFSR